jgi:putative ABC transport system permease protein
LCRIIGASNGFLEFVQRAPLEIYISPIALCAAGAAALLFMVNTLIPTFFGAGVNIVESKRKRAYRRLPFYHRYFLDVLLFGAGIYGYITIRQKLQYYDELRQHYTMSVENSEFLLYVCGVMFSLGAGMLFLRIYPLIVRLVFKLGKRIWPSWLYFSLNRTGQNRDCSSIMLFLIMTLSIGIFSADSARSINNHIETNVKLKMGTDVVYTPRWKKYNAETGEEVRGYVAPGSDFVDIIDEDGNLIQRIPIVFREIFADAFEEYDEVESVARVYYENDARVRYSLDTQRGVTVMCIDPYDFATTAYSTAHMNPYHINDYINALLTMEDGVLISNNLMKKLGVEQGEQITIMSVAGEINCRVVAGVETWPGIETYYIDESGELQTTDFVIAELDSLLKQNKVVPYSFWIKKANGVSDRELYDVLSASEHGVAQFDSSSAGLVEAKNRPVLQGTNGLLSVSFLTSIVICALGFMIYWIISIKSRTLQFGISRALGVTKTGIMLMLITEQILISGMAVAVGFILGKIGSYLFVPLLGLNYVSADDVVPFVVRALRSDVYQILGVMGGMLLVCFAIISGIVIRQKIDRAVKLGEE